jgi:catechol 2,3-dioxygenase-like lactoylglutathione lyase family enzyme
MASVIAHESTEAPGQGVLAGSRIVALTVFVNDLAQSRAFYEGRLGLRVLEADAGCTWLDAGSTLLCLRRAADHGVRLRGKRDDSSDTVWLVDDIEAMRAALERRGIEFARRRTYEVGRVVDFYDPNGHRLMLYEPSPKALTWPSGPKLKAIWEAHARGGTDLIGPAAVPVQATAEELEAWGLDGKPLAYFFVFVDDEARALDLFEGALGLPALEKVHCCYEGCPKESRGVIKYDGGGVVLTTHHLHGEHFIRDDNGVPYGVRDFDPKYAKGVAPVLHVADIDSAVARLAARGVPFPAGIERDDRGATARFEAPSGHLFFLYQPSPRARATPAGVRLGEILDVSV